MLAANKLEENSEAERESKNQRKEQKMEAMKIISSLFLCI